MTILLHTSKTMRSPGLKGMPMRRPVLLSRAKELDIALKKLSTADIQKLMRISSTLAEKTHNLITAWSDTQDAQSLAIDSFVGDIYSGLRADQLSDDERSYADRHMYILSGLYGVLKPFDAICPYRFEMGYKAPDGLAKNMYDFWVKSIAACIPESGPIINITAAEYAKVVTPYIDTARIIAPRFLTIDPKTNQPTFVVVHAKIARGAFARWLITTRLQDTHRLHEFKELGYVYDTQRSTPEQPVFICKAFGGKGLSMRLL